MASLTEARAAIREIDRAIDAGRRDRKPDHQQRENDLFRQRGEWQLVRDRILAERAARPRRVARLPKCPTCRGSGFAKAA